jgi:hypothetical protein
MQRRHFLATTVGVATALAGCRGRDESAATTATDSTTTRTTGAPSRSDTDDATDVTTTGTATLDLREANVTAVAVDPDGDQYRFEVTLYHDDDGEDGYANWWQLETLDGERLGRRDLGHAHGTRPFTRSATVAVPADTTCVVVRGHDQTHGYGGQAMVVTLADGTTRTVRQGPAREPISRC